VAVVRTYRTKPGRRADFVKLFQTRAGPAQLDYGMTVIGPLLDKEDPDVLVWLRAFPSAEQRQPIKDANYEGQLWKKQLEHLALPLLAEYSAAVCSAPWPSAASGTRTPPRRTSNGPSRANSTSAATEQTPDRPLPPTVAVSRLTREPQFTDHPAEQLPISYRQRQPPHQSPLRGCWPQRHHPPLPPAAKTISRPLAPDAHDAPRPHALRSIPGLGKT
jgi:hypothetical protein